MALGKSYPTLLSWDKQLDYKQYQAEHRNLPRFSERHILCVISTAAPRGSDGCHFCFLQGIV